MLISDDTKSINFQSKMEDGELRRRNLEGNVRAAEMVDAKEQEQVEVKEKVVDSEAEDRAVVGEDIAKSIGQDKPPEVRSSLAVKVETFAADPGASTERVACQVEELHHPLRLHLAHDRRLRSYHLRRPACSHDHRLLRPSQGDPTIQVAVPAITVLLRNLLTFFYFSVLLGDHQHRVRRLQIRQFAMV